MTCASTLCGNVSAARTYSRMRVGRVADLLVRTRQLQARVAEARVLLKRVTVLHDGFAVLLLLDEAVAAGEVLLLGALGVGGAGEGQRGPQHQRNQQWRARFSNDLWDRHGSTGSCGSRGFGWRQLRKDTPSVFSELRIEVECQRALERLPPASLVTDLHERDAEVVLSRGVFRVASRRASSR